MGGYNQMNGSYNEQPGVNWGKVAAYGAGSVMAVGMMRMGMRGFSKAAARGNTAVRAQASAAKRSYRIGRGKSARRAAHNKRMSPPLALGHDSRFDAGRTQMGPTPIPRVLGTPKEIEGFERAARAKTAALQSKRSRKAAAQRARANEPRAIGNPFSLSQGPIVRGNSQTDMNWFNLK
jgi:hypothetical protein